MKTYKVDYCNGFVMTVDAEDLKQVIEKALESAAHTQENIIIEDERYQKIATSYWYGIPPEEWDQPILEIGGGFYDGFVDAITGDYI